MNKPSSDSATSISLVVASNNAAVLESSLLASPDLDGSVEVIVERDPPSACRAYNAGLSRARGDLVVFPHQDVFFPPGWAAQLRKAAHYLDETDPQWAVLGVFGLDFEGRARGRVYSTGLKRTVGSALPVPVPVQSLDEVVLVVRRDSGLRFDDQLPGFHLYGTDICLEARRQGRSAYAFEGCCLHNTNGIDLLPWNYWKIWLWMRRKWWRELPVVSPCMTISRNGKEALKYVAKQPIINTLRSSKPGSRVPDPVELWRSLEA